MDNKVEMVTFTPEEASALLESSLNSQWYAGPSCKLESSLYKNKIKLLADEMKGDSWDPYSSVVHIDEDGVLLTGYGRMAACVLANVSFGTVVVRLHGTHAIRTCTHLG